MYKQYFIIIIFVIVAIIMIMIMGNLLHPIASVSRSNEGLSPRTRFHLE